ncbi:hypothetical protein ALC57_09419, partial [Trachymyrmex cornetzi]
KEKQKEIERKRRCEKMKGWKEKERVYSCTIEDIAISGQLHYVYKLRLYSPSGNILGVLASAAAVGIADLENCANRATVFPGDALKAYVVLSAILRMGVSAEAAGCAAHFSRSRTQLLGGKNCKVNEANRKGVEEFVTVICLEVERLVISEIDTFVSAFGNLVGPHAHPSFTVIGQSGTALITGGLAIPTVPEDITLLLIREDAVEAGAVRRVDRRFELRALAAVYIVQIIAVLGEELVVAGVKCQTVAARLQFRHVVVAFPILVARYVMRIEPEVIRTFEGLLAVRS